MAVGCPVTNIRYKRSNSAPSPQKLRKVPFTDLTVHLDPFTDLNVRGLVPFTDLTVHLDPFTDLNVHLDPFTDLNDGLQARLQTYLLVPFTDMRVVPFTDINGQQTRISTCAWSHLQT